MSKGTQYLHAIARKKVKGIPSFCSSNEMVLEAVLEYARDNGEHALIECTANQVNQYGGYTGMKPEDFRSFVLDLAEKTGLKKDRLILGGDHLGPVVFKDKDENEAMEMAEEMVVCYVKAGFEKIHIDTSMRLASDDVNKPLTDATIAQRAVKLCSAAEAAYENAFGKPSELVYVIGSEVPIPGGEQAGSGEMKVTTPEHFENTVKTFREAFQMPGLKNAFDRIIALVVQPGVDFGDDSLYDYDHGKSTALTRRLKTQKGIVFEGHSTDYQTPDALAAMANDGIGILKVGPELTFALREGLFALQYIDENLSGKADFIDALERVMVERPSYWEKYYQGTSDEIALKRKFSYSDRWRYYASDKQVKDSIRKLFFSFSKRTIPMTLLSQFMPDQYKKIRSGLLINECSALAKDKVKDVVEKYYMAVK